MKALFTLKPQTKQTVVVAVLLSLIPLGFPGTTLAATVEAGVNTALVFEVKNPIQNQNSISFNEVVMNDPLVEKLEAYLKKHNSPLAEYSPQIIQEKHWKKALAISWVESNFGRRCADNNCSGIGVAPGHPAWRKYSTKLDWFKDMNVLMDKPLYSEKYNTFRKMKGIYVYPGSENWVRGAEQKFAELTELEEQAREARLAMHKDLIVSAANPTTIELTNILE